MKARPRHWDPERNRMTKNEIDKMLKNDVIRPSRSPWASPVVLVGKPDGSCRFAIDYRRVNDVLALDSYPLPHIQELLDGLCGKSWFTALDNASGYCAVPVKESDKPLTAFVTKYGLFEFNVAPFGIATMPSIYSRMMAGVLRGLAFAAVFLDDTLVHSTTVREHSSHLRMVFMRLTAAGIQLKATKVKLLQRTVEYLGHVINEPGVQPSPRLVEKVQKI